MPRKASCWPNANSKTTAAPANEAAERIARELRDEITLTNSGTGPAIERLKTEKAAVEQRLRAARDERANCSATSTRSSSRPKAPQPPAHGKRAVRERVDDTARGREARDAAGRTEFAIETMLTAEPAVPARRRSPSTARPQRDVPEGGGTPAERIRALQPAPPAPGTAAAGLSLPILSLTPVARTRKSQATTTASPERMPLCRPSIVHENPGRLAQRKSVPFTRERSKVRSLVRPPI